MADRLDRHSRSTYYLLNHKRDLKGLCEDPYDVNLPNSRHWFEESRKVQRSLAAWIGFEDAKAFWQTVIASGIRDSMGLTTAVKLEIARLESIATDEEMESHAAILAEWDAMDNAEYEAEKARKAAEEQARLKEAAARRKAEKLFIIYTSGGDVRWRFKGVFREWIATGECMGETFWEARIENHFGVEMTIPACFLGGPLPPLPPAPMCG